MNDNIDFELQIKNEFVNEARELLDETESCFLELEKNPENNSLIDNIFRLAHTVKGSGYAAGFVELAEFAHIFETLLGEIRSGETLLNSDIVDVLLQSNDTLIKYVEILSDDYDSFLDTSDVSEKIKKFLVVRNSNITDSGGSESGLNLFKDSESPENSNSTNDKLQVHKVGSGYVLVVDDEPDVCDLFETFLEDFEFPLLIAKNGLEAINIIKNNKIELIFSDVKMPKMTGIQFIEEVRKFDKNIPVVFVSGAAEKEDVIKFIEFGAYAFIQKPFDQDKLIVEARNAIKMKLTRDSIVKLSGLNYKAYIASLRLSKMNDESNLSKRKDLTKQLESYLDDIAELTNNILKVSSNRPKKDMKTAS